MKRRQLRAPWLALFLAVVLTSAACSTDNPSGSRDDAQQQGHSSDGDSDGGADFGNAALASMDDAGPATLGNGGLMTDTIDVDAGPCADESCGNDTDDDCDGTIDEGCRCDGEDRPCFTGDPEAAGVGACQMGTQRCGGGAGEFDAWGACEGSILPTEEACDGEVDEDCDGEIDEDLGDCCEPGEMRDCPLEEGQCIPGRQHCDTHREWTECRGGMAAGEAEDVCNGRDDDCDGLTDEDFVASNTPGQPVLSGANYEAHWYSGNFLIDWRTTPPGVTCPAAGMAYEGSSTWSDPVTGDLRYYSNGLTLWDASGNAVANGTGLSGNSTATETSFFAPVPGSGLAELMVFVNDTSHVYYSILDLASGSIDAASKNTLVASNTGEAIGGIDDLAGGFWLVLLNGASLDGYHVVSRSIDALPDAQSPLPLTVSASSRATIRFSRDRSRIAIATETPPGLWWAPFDAASGSVIGSWTQISTLQGYSVEFSPSGRMIYYAAEDGDYGWQANQLWQYDTQLASNTPIATGTFSGVALAPDGSVYTHGYSGTTLHRVVTPDVGGSANFQLDALDLAGCSVGFNLSKQLFLPTVAGCTEGDCDDANPCTADLCDEDTGACTHTCTECAPADG